MDFIGSFLFHHYFRIVYSGLNNTSYISYTIQRRELVPSSFNSFRTTLYEYVPYRSVKWHCVAHYTLRLEMFSANVWLPTKIPISFWKILTNKTSIIGKLELSVLNIWSTFLRMQSRVAHLILSDMFSEGLLKFSLHFLIFLVSSFLWIYRNIFRFFKFSYVFNIFLRCLSNLPKIFFNFSHKFSLKSLFLHQLFHTYYKFFQYSSSSSLEKPGPCVVGILFFPWGPA